MRIVIAATHRVFASALGLLLRRSGRDVVGYAMDIDAVADMIVRERADACLVDADMPWEPEVIAAAMAALPGTAFVVLADGPSAGLSRALSAGAHGVVLKSDDFIELTRVLTAARARVDRRTAGRPVLSQSVQAARRTMRARRRPELACSLTPREREVLSRLVRGESTLAIARSMGVRLSTTRTHIDSVLMKLGVHSRIEAVAHAVREGIVDVADGGAGTGRDRAIGEVFSGLCEPRCSSSLTTESSPRAWRRFSPLSRISTRWWRTARSRPSTSWPRASPTPR